MGLAGGLIKYTGGELAKNAAKEVAKSTAKNVAKNVGTSALNMLSTAVPKAVSSLPNAVIEYAPGGMSQNTYQYLLSAGKAREGLYNELGQNISDADKALGGWWNWNKDGRTTNFSDIDRNLSKELIKKQGNKPVYRVEVRKNPQFGEKMNYNSRAGDNVSFTSDIRAIRNYLESLNDNNVYSAQLYKSMATPDNTVITPEVFGSSNSMLEYVLNTPDSLKPISTRYPAIEGNYGDMLDALERDMLEDLKNSGAEKYLVDSKESIFNNLADKYGSTKTNEIMNWYGGDIGKSAKSAENSFLGRLLNGQEVENPLVMYHSTSPDKLRQIFDIADETYSDYALPNPSLQVVDPTKNAGSDYGEIILLGNKSIPGGINKYTGGPDYSSKYNLFSRDIYSPRKVRINYNKGLPKIGFSEELATPDNISKFMNKKSVIGGEDTMPTPGMLAATSAKRLKSPLDAIKNSDLLQPKDVVRDAISKWDDKVAGSVDTLLDKYMASNPDINRYSYSDYIMTELAETMKGAKPWDDPYGINTTDVGRNIVKDLQTTAQSLPTDYFEAKANRAVPMKEFGGVILPENFSDPRIEKVLADSGLEVLGRYNPENYQESLGSVLNNLIKDKDRLTTPYMMSKVDNMPKGYNILEKYDDISKVSTFDLLNDLGEDAMALSSAKPTEFRDKMLDIISDPSVERTVRKEFLARSPLGVRVWADRGAMDKAITSKASKIPKSHALAMGGDLDDLMNIYGKDVATRNNDKFGITGLNLDNLSSGGDASSVLKGKAKLSSGDAYTPSGKDVTNDDWKKYIEEQGFKLKNFNRDELQESTWKVIQDEMFEDGRPMSQYRKAYDELVVQPNRSNIANGTVGEFSAKDPVAANDEYLDMLLDLSERPNGKNNLSKMMLAKKGRSLTEIAADLRAMQEAKKPADGIKRIGSSAVAKIDENTLPAGYEKVKKYIERHPDNLLADAIGQWPNVNDDAFMDKVRNFITEAGYEPSVNNYNNIDLARKIIYEQGAEDLAMDGASGYSEFLRTRGEFGQQGGGYGPGSYSISANDNQLYQTDAAKLDREMSDRLGIGRSHTPMNDKVLSNDAAGYYYGGGIGIAPQHNTGESGLSTVAHERMHAWQHAKRGEWDDRVIDAIEELQDELKKHYHSEEQLAKDHNVRKGSKNMEYYASEGEQQARMLQSYLDNEGFTNTWKAKTGKVEYGKEIKPAFDKFYKKLRELSKLGVALPAIAALFGLSANSKKNETK